MTRPRPSTALEEAGGESRPGAAASGLRWAEHRLTLAFAASPDGLLISSILDGRIQEANESFLRMFGLTRDEVVGRCSTELGLYPTPEDRERVVAAFEAQGRLRDFEIELLHRDGGRRTLLLAAEPLEDEGLVLKVFHDVTDARRAERDLRESEARLAAEAAALSRLNEASARLWGLHNLQDGLDEVLRAGIELMGADKGNLQLMGDRGEALLIAAHQEFDGPFLDAFRRVSLADDCLCARALRTGGRVLSEDVEADERFAEMRELARRSGFRAVQSTPLFSRDGGLIGMLSTHWARPHRPSDSELRRLDLYTRQAADFIERCRAHDALRESENRFRELADAAPVLVWMSDADKRGVYFNQTWLAFTGMPAHEQLGEGWLRLVHPDDREPLAAVCGESFHRREPFTTEFRLRRADGVYRWVLDAGSPRFDSAGNFMGFVGSCVDITDRRESEAALRESEQRLRAVLQVLPLPVFIADATGRLVVTNPAADAVWGPAKLSADPSQYAEDYRAWWPGTGRRVQAEEWGMARALAAGEVVTAEELDVESGGERRTILNYARPIRDDAGEIAGAVAVNVDITDRKRSEEASGRLAEELRLVTDAVPALISYVDAEGRYRLNNAKYEEWFAVSREELRGKHLREVLGEVAYARLREQVEAALRGDRVAFEGEVPYRSGGTRDVRAEYVPHVRPDGSVDGFYALVTDISARKRAERELARGAREQGALYEFTDRLHRARSLDEVYSAALDAVMGALQCDRASLLLFDDSGQMRFVGWRGLSDGYRAAVEGHSPWGPDARDPAPICLADASVADLEPELRETILREGIAALAFIPLTGADRLIGKFMIYYDAPHQFEEHELSLGMAIGRQLAFGVARKRAEIARQQVFALAESAAEFVGMCDARHQPFYINAAGLKTVGLSPEQVCHTSLAEFFFPEDLPFLTEQFLPRVLREGHAETEIRFRHFETGAPIWMVYSVVVLTDDRGGINGFGAVATNITARKRAEEELQLHRDRLEQLVHERTAQLEETHRRLRLSERMASLGTLSAGLGHDMGNILVPMRVWIDLLGQMRLPDDALHHLRSLHQSTEYLKSLASGLRSLSLDPEDPAAAPVRTYLAEWWQEVHGVYRAALPKSVSLHPLAADGYPPVRMPPHALTQVVFNLVQNAGNALRQQSGGNIWIEARVEGEAVRLSVRDDGPGMTADVRARCMEPFFTTKARGRGTGLGLSIVHNAVHRYGGSVAVESEPQRGAEFILTLPLAPDSPQVDRAAAVTIADARTGAIVRMILTGMGVEPKATLDRPEGRLWVVDAAVPESSIRFFIESDPAHRVVRIGEPGELGPRVACVAEPRPSALRAAFARAAAREDAP